MISLADKVFSGLESDILHGKYHPGDVLTEQKLSEALGVSRTPVREAVRRLEQEGLLKESGKGMVVLGLSREDLCDAFEIRKRIEGLAARRAAGMDDEALIKRLKDIVELQEFYLAKGDADHIHILDGDFHSAIYENCGSTVLKSVLSDLHRKLGLRRLASVTDKDRAEMAVAEHRAIYEAIADHDARAAELQTERHICNAYESIIRKEMK